MLKGFKDFIMRGNLIELAVAFVIGAAFATVVTATAVIMGVIGKIGGQPELLRLHSPAASTSGGWINAVIAFVIVARSSTSSWSALQQAAGADHPRRGGRTAGRRHRAAHRDPRPARRPSRHQQRRVEMDLRRRPDPRSSRRLGGSQTWRSRRLGGTQALRRADSAASAISRGAGGPAAEPLVARVGRSLRRRRARRWCCRAARRRTPGPGGAAARRR